jgi:hypothetical protein
MSLCYALVSTGYLLKHVTGPGQTNTNNQILCTVQFVLVYYFDVAACVWWLTLAVGWYLTAALRWSGESVGRLGWMFHSVAWLLPAVLTLCALFVNIGPPASFSIDSDPLTGVCSIGNQDAQALRAYLILPHAVLLTLGVGFWLGGFVSLIRLTTSSSSSAVLKARQLLKSDELLRGDDILQTAKRMPYKQRLDYEGKAAIGDECLVVDETGKSRLNKLMVRIGVFVVLYTVPATCVLAAHLYEYAINLLF